MDRKIKRIELTCKSCGKTFSQTLAGNELKDIKKNIDWYKKHQPYCLHCRNLMGKTHF